MSGLGLQYIEPVESVMGGHGRDIGYSKGISLVDLCDRGAQVANKSLVIRIPRLFLLGRIVIADELVQFLARDPEQASCF